MSFCNSTQFVGQRVHLVVTGSVAAYKACSILRCLKSMGLQVSVTISEGARHFVSPLLFEALGGSPIYTEMFAPEQGCFAHLEPGECAQTLLVAPASANALANLANGCASPLYAAQVLAFTGNLLLAPAMNSKMWRHAACQDNCTTLKKRGAVIIAPRHGSLACGDVGDGKLADIDEIIWATLRSLAPQDMAQKKVLLTLGPTREFWDGVRFWSNPSSGRMGAALALCAYLRGAEVFALCGAGVPKLPEAVHRYECGCAEEMRACAEALWDEQDYGFFCAAVADFAPKKRLQTLKCKKKDFEDSFFIEFQKNVDILQTLSKKKTKQKILAFAAETVDSIEDLLPLALEKCQRKGADLLCANRVNAENSGFESTTNEVCVVESSGKSEIWPLLAKSDVAWRLCSWLLRV
ncbi:MAG: bifunctional phosphopantothenoylcysteine decarboxylase/phosphopantothenate--cysteine ligase CoaBC [Desulfovibrio sp.]|nr:bifunctional phosphopantothenoylcysteine decarboxylase/phosphopantothenate--cysteine ligase CoaBC [Desulfovibrio sp.]